MNGRLLPTPDLTADAFARDGFFVGIHLDSAAAPIRLGDQRVDFRRAARDGPATRCVALGGGAAWSADRWQLTRGTRTRDERAVRLDAEPPLVLSGDREGTVSSTWSPTTTARGSRRAGAGRRPAASTTSRSTRGTSTSAASACRSTGEWAAAPTRAWRSAAARESRAGRSTAGPRTPRSAGTAATRSRCRSPASAARCTSRTCCSSWTAARCAGRRTSSARRGSGRTR